MVVTLQRFSISHISLHDIECIWSTALRFLMIFRITYCILFKLSSNSFHLPFIYSLFLIITLQTLTHKAKNFRLHSPSHPHRHPSFNVEVISLCFFRMQLIIPCFLEKQGLINTSLKLKNLPVKNMLNRLETHLTTYFVSCKIVSIAILLFKF